LVPVREADQEDLGLAIGMIGENVRRERKRQQLNVKQLSERAKVSFGLISELERGMGNPSIQSLHRLAQALRVPLPKLLTEATGDTMVVRAGERSILAPSGDQGAQREVRRELLTPRGQSELQLIRSTLPPGFSNEAMPFRHLGTEAVVVESGVLVVEHGQRRVTLHEGDSITYGCSTPHWWANTTENVTVVLGAVTPLEA